MPQKTDWQVLLVFSQQRYRINFYLTPYLEIKF